MAILKYIYSLLKRSHRSSKLRRAVSCGQILPITAVMAVCPFLTSCFSEFEPDIDSTPVLCMNTLITPGDTIDLLLSRTWRWSEGAVNDGRGHYTEDKLIDVTVRDATVKLYVNGNFREEMKLFRIHNIQWGTDQYEDVFRAEYIPQSGDNIRFEAYSKEYGEAWAEVDVPEPVDIYDVEFSLPSAPWHNPDTGEYTLSPSFKIWFEDPVAQQNFYDFSIGHSNYLREESDDDTVTDHGIDYFQNFWAEYDHEPLFTEHVSALDGAFSETYGYTIFTDRQINGKKYPLTIVVNNLLYISRNPNNNPELGNGTIDFTLYSVSKSYYEHVLSVWQANDGITGVLGNIGFADLVYASSNVSTNAGVVAASTPYVFKLPMKKIFEKYPPRETNENLDPWSPGYVGPY